MDIRERLRVVTGVLLSIGFGFLVGLGIVVAFHYAPPVEPKIYIVVPGPDSYQWDGVECKPEGE